MNTFNIILGKYEQTDIIAKETLRLPSMHPVPLAQCLSQILPMLNKILHMKRNK